MISTRLLWKTVVASKQETKNKTKKLIYFFVNLPVKIELLQEYLPLVRMECKISDIQMLSNEKRQQYEDEIKYITKKVRHQITPNTKKDWEALLIYRKMIMARDNLYLTMNSKGLKDEMYKKDLETYLNLINQYEKTPKRIEYQKKQTAIELNKFCKSVKWDSNIVSCSWVPYEETESVALVPLVSPPVPHINWSLPQPGDLDDLYA